MSTEVSRITKSEGLRNQTGREVRTSFESKLRYEVAGHVQDLTHVHASSSDCLNRALCFVEQVQGKIVSPCQFSST